MNFQKSRALVSARFTSISFKRERLSVGLSMNDLLNQNVNVTRTITPTSIENSQFNALKRYAMLQVSYRLSKFGGMM